MSHSDENAYPESSTKSSGTSNGKGRVHGEKIEIPLLDLPFEILPQLVGERDENIKLIENKLHVRIGRRESGFSIEGEDFQAKLAADLISQVVVLLQRGETIFPGDLDRAIEMLSQDRRTKLEDLFRDQVSIAGRKRRIVPKTFRQKEYIDAMKAYDIVFGLGPAGTGKTYLAMAMAVSALLNKDVKRIVLCRPAVEAGEKLGFLPGDMAEKVNPYLRPLYDALHDMIDYERAEELIEKGTIEVAPLAFMRGRTLSNAFVILDEAQNTTSMQMKMVLTRIGPGSKLVVAGDPSQVDLPRGVISGLHDAVKILKNIKEIAFLTFEEQDVIRHKLVRAIVNAYKQHEDL